MTELTRVKCEWTPEEGTPEVAFIGFGESDFGNKPDIVFIMADDVCIAVYEAEWEFCVSFTDDGDDIDVYHLVNHTNDRPWDIGMSSEQLFSTYMDGGMEMRWV